jgi:hypothetical protein
MKCRKREGCTVPCAPVEQEINRETYKHYLERQEITKDGDRIAVLWPDSSGRARPFSHFVHEQKGNILAAVSMEDAEEFWGMFVPRTKRMGIFIDRFFNRWSYQDLAVKYDLRTQEAARKSYHASLQELFRVIALFDEGKRENGRRGAMTKAKSKLNKLPAYANYYILNKCLEMPPSEIAKVLDVSPGAVKSGVSYASQALKQGEDIFKLAS